MLGPTNLAERLPTVEIRDGTLTFEDREAVVLQINKLRLTLLNDPLPTLTLEGQGEADVLGPVIFRGSIDRATMATHIEIEIPTVPVNEELWRRAALLYPSAAGHLRQLAGHGEVRIKFELPGSALPSDPRHKDGHEVALKLRKGSFSHPRLPVTLQDITFETAIINGQVPTAIARAVSGPARVEANLKGLRLSPAHRIVCTRRSQPTRR